MKIKTNFLSLIALMSRINDMQIRNTTRTDPLNNIRMRNCIAGNCLLTIKYILIQCVNYTLFHYI